jgi:beta-ribofuranosylaminobenzene 5'-phosphate synthase
VALRQAREQPSNLTIVPPSAERGASFGVRIAAPARLHLGFIDLSGSRGRRFGSVGLTIEGMATTLRLQTHDAQTTVHGADAAVNARATQYLALLTAQGLVHGKLELQVEQAAPAHAGFGSGTQLALALARSVRELFDLPLSLAELARMLERGARSGIGLGAFEQGGFLVDGGHSLWPRLAALDTPPPLLARADFPPAWRVLLILDDHAEGLHGHAERAAFEALPAFPRASAEQLSHAVLMQALPALAEEDLPQFGAAITELQQVVGDYFAPAQGGRYASPAVAEVLRHLALEGVVGYGQSSWGPTGFALFASDEAAQDWRARLTAKFAHQKGLSFAVVAGRNRGAEVARTAAEPSQHMSAA